MKVKISTSFVALAVASFAGSATAAPAPRTEILNFKGPFEVDVDSLHNIHIDITDRSFAGEIHVVYGDCESATRTSNDHSVIQTEVQHGQHPSRLVWIVPQDAASDGCLHGFSGDKLIGRSAPITMKTEKLLKRQSIADVSEPLGRWFDGVHYMKNKPNSGVFIGEAKNKRIAIIGAGMAGLMTSHLLSSVGLDNWEIMESSQRIGGRVRTKYFNNTAPGDYQYQEMGPMRFPVSIKYKETGEVLPIKDHQMVFHLAEVLNHKNSVNNPELKIEFIPWTQSSPNTPANSRGVRLQNGRIPSAADIAADPTLRGVAPAAPNATEAEIAEKAVEDFIGMNDERMRLIANDLYSAHKKAIEAGLFDWSEASFLKHKLGLSKNTTDFLAGAQTGSPFWDYDNVYFSADTWRTIDKGLNQLPNAFMPFIKDRITFGRKVSGLKYKNETGKIEVNWRDEGHEFDLKPQGEEFDYAVVAAPFSKVRLWNLPQYSSLLSRAISTMNYQQSCKVALHYKTRFWEHMDPPILGGCGSVDVPGVGSVCYPSYQMNSTGPGVILGSYSSGSPARSLAALSEKDHVALVQRAMVEFHGEIAAEQYTGLYDRVCWEMDEHAAGAWAAPIVGQQELFIPAYFQTEFKTIFVGEHTSYTHAWIFSALDSAVRGTTQLLLDLGLVDEAKTIVDAWMGRWIKL